MFSKSKGLIRSFAHDRSGDVALMFGMLVIILMVSIGAAVDMGRWIHARSQTAAAVDSAVLAGARTLQLDGSNQTAAIEAATRYYNQNVSSRLPLSTDTISFIVTDNGTAMTATGNAFISTPLLALAGVPQLPLLKLSGSEYGKAVLSAGGESEQDLEISLMLDVTGSMCSPCDKIDALKEAAKDLIDIVIWEDQSSYTSKVALVPFSQGVNASAIGAGGNTITALAGKQDPATRTFSLMNGQTQTWNRSSECLSERSGPEAFTDASPDGADRIGRVYTSNGNCKPPNAIVPLSNDAESLKTTIDGFSAQGYTAGHIGTAWAWYMLSPNWTDVLPSQSLPGSYSELTEENSNGAPKLRKIAVLMTDGEYNTQYCTTGIRDRHSGDRSSRRGTCTSPNGDSATQARTLCSNMKATGIEVYTIGFQLASSGDSHDTMSQCASTSEHFYVADDGEQLRQAFRDIALKISTIHLSR